MVMGDEGEEFFPPPEYPCVEVSSAVRGFPRINPLPEAQRAVVEPPEE